MVAVAAAAAAAAAAISEVIARKFFTDKLLLQVDTESLTHRTGTKAMYCKLTDSANITWSDGRQVQHTI